MQFSDLKTGDRAKIVGFSCDDKAYRQKLLAMGLTKGTEFVVLRKAPLGDPYNIEVRGFSLTLRKSEANVLTLEAV